MAIRSPSGVAADSNASVGFAAEIQKATAQAYLEKGLTPPKALDDTENPPILYKRPDPKTGQGGEWYQKSQFMKDFYSMKGQELQDLQQKLWKAGYYGGLSWDQVRKQTHDPATQKAYDAFLTNAANQYQAFGGTAGGDMAGSAPTADEILDEEGALSLNEADRPINLEDIKSGIRSVALNIIGRPIDDATLETIASKVPAIVNEYGGAPTQAWYEDQIRALKPVETQATNQFNNVGSFLKMIDTQGLYSAYNG